MNALDLARFVWPVLALAFVVLIVMGLKRVNDDGGWRLVGVPCALLLVAVVLVRFLDLPTPDRLLSAK